MYPHQKIEKKWQKYWKEYNTFQTPNFSLKPKYYVLDMFPYPSGAGLHVGHPEWYTANDIIARYKHAKGYNVLHPMGWDAFGLPAENYAIKTGTHPSITTKENIATFKRQIESLGFSYDWEREIDTTDPDFFQWTQWIFLKLFEHGLAYEQDLPINYCPSCATGLANEEVLWDFSCERCGDQVVKKKIRQWVLAITQYAERLLQDVDDLDWPEGIKDMQRNWIGKSEGCEFEMKKRDNKNHSIRVYTTRVDTVFGMTYAVIAPDHLDVQNFISDEYRTDCETYIDRANKQSDQDRTADGKEKTGVFTGSFVLNPYNDESVPLWIADYVLGNYGTGAVMAVPAHDVRDFEFAKKYDLPIKQSIESQFEWDWEKATTNYGTLVNSWEYNWLTSQQAKEQLTALAQEKWFGAKKVNYKLRDWLFSRQRYWWEPIPLIHLETKDVEKLPKISREDLQVLQEKVEKVVNKKMRSDSPRLKNSVGSHARSGRVSNSSLFQIIMRDILFVKNKKKNFDMKSVSQKFQTDIWEIRVSWRYLHEHFKYKKLKERKNRRRNFFSIYENIENISFHKGEENLYYGIICIDWTYWLGILEEVQNKIFDLKTFYNFSSLNKVLSSDAHLIEDNTLVTNAIEYSKIYNGLYTKIICDYDLPVKLPEVQEYKPAGDGNSPLVNVPDFVNVQIAKNLSGKRETNTMPQWGWSCWYYLRFMDPKNQNALVWKNAEKYWGNVDSYVWGTEHAVLHLLYARFWHKFLYDIGAVSTHEPFYRLRNQGMILGMSYKNSKGKLIAADLVEERDGKYVDIETGDELEKIPAKMSKSLKNVINPDDIVKEYGADTLRMYEMYMADFKDAAPWDTSSIVGLRRFLDKVYVLFVEGKEKFASSDEEALKVLHKAIKKIGEDIENYKFNTAIAQLMILMNTGIPKSWEWQRQWKKSFLILLHPFAPHMAEECWKKLRESEKWKNTEYKKVYFATSNAGKIERAQKCLKVLDESVQLLSYPDVQKVEETWNTPLECALQKLEPYIWKGIEVPVISADTAVYFEGQDFDPTHVRRIVFESLWKSEDDLSAEEMAREMVEFYKKKAQDAGGELDFYYQDAFVILFPNGEIKTHAYNRYYKLTDQHEGDIHIHVPMRWLYYSCVTGKRATETSEDDYLKEFASQVDALRELFGYERESIFFESWPEYDEQIIIDNELTIGVQVLWKLRGEIQISKDEDQPTVLEKAKNNENVAKWLEGKHIIKEIYVPGKIVNIVVK